MLATRAEVGRRAGSVGAVSVFPRQAQKDGISGRVVAHVYVAPAGNVTDVKIVSAQPPRVFDREVIRALSQWKFNPEPVGFIGEYEIVFNLKD